MCFILLRNKCNFGGSFEIICIFGEFVVILVGHGKSVVILVGSNKIVVILVGHGKKCCNYHVPGGFAVGADLWRRPGEGPRKVCLRRTGGCGGA